MNIYFVMCCLPIFNCLPIFLTEQSAGFNPSGMNFIEQQPTPMFSEDGRAYQTPGQFQSMGSQSETASFFGQMPTEGGLIESNNVSLRDLGLEIFNSQVFNRFLNYNAGHI